jgi:hypothetical protein
MCLPWIGRQNGRQNPCKIVEDLEEFEACSSENGLENAENSLAHTVGVTGSSPVPPIPRSCGSLAR